MGWGHGKWERGGGGWDAQPCIEDTDESGGMSTRVPKKNKIEGRKRRGEGED